MRVVLRYEAGRAVWSDNEPPTAHLSGIGGTTLAGGYPRVFRDAAPEPEAAPKRRYRPGRETLRGQALLDRGRHDR